MTKDGESKLLAELLGSQLSSVEFVQDYLQLRFDGPCINVYNPLTVRTELCEITSWNNGFRDLLCKQIAKIVNHVTFESQKELRIQFTDTSEVVISLRNGDYTSSEAVYCHGFENEGWFSE